MNLDDLYSAFVVRMMKNENIQSLAGDPVNAYKGSSRPNGYTNPSFTVHSPDLIVEPDTTAANGTIFINAYVDNFKSGNANTELLGDLLKEIKDEFNDRPLEINGYNNFNLAVTNLRGPLYDSSDPDEHFGSVMLNINIVKS